MGDLAAEVTFSDLLHPRKNHTQDLLRGKLFLSFVGLDLNCRVIILGDNCKREALDVGLHVCLVELATDETPKVRLTTGPPTFLTEK